MNAEQPLPQGWRWEMLSEVCEPIRGVNFPADEAVYTPALDTVACVTTSAVQAFVEWTTARHIPSRYASDEAQFLRLGDVIVSTANSKELVGKSCMVTSLPFPCMFGAFVTVLRPRKGVDAFYLSYAMRRREALEACYSLSSNTTGISNLKVSDLIALKIPLPPLAEQQRIAARLNAHMAAVEQARAAARLQIQTAAMFASAALRGVFDSKDAFTWPTAPLASVAETTSGSTPPREIADYYIGDIPWVKTGELKDSAIDSTEEHVSRRAADECRLRILPVGTLLVAMYGQGQTRGRTGLLQVSATINQACFAIVSSPDRLVPEFLQAWFRHNYIRIRSLSESRGGNQPNLNGELLSGLIVPIPTLHVQRDAVQRLQEQSVDAARVEAASRAQLAAINALPAALLRAAFSGQLV